MLELKINPQKKKNTVSDTSANKDTLSKEKELENENEETKLIRNDFAHYVGTSIDAGLREQILKLGPCNHKDNFQDAKGRAFHHLIIVSYPRQDKRSKGNGCAIQHDFMLLTVRYVGFSLIEKPTKAKEACSTFRTSESDLTSEALLPPNAFVLEREHLSTFIVIMVPFLLVPEEIPENF
ncbi:hypothetical protein TNCV_944861 [Trichonephila clavipes]|nr:hypothetical protein TNCV_944861 [Trichonephila clavipes]